MYPAVFGFFGASCCKNNAVSDDHHTGMTSQPIVARIAFPFVLGMATATAIMGLLTAVLGWVFGQFVTEFLLLLAIIPMFMGLHMLGILPLPVTAWHLHQPRINISRKWYRAATAYGAGLVFSLAIAPCATPILLSILALVALQGDPVFGTALMFTYGLGTGLPLLLIGHGFTHLQHLLRHPDIYGLFANYPDYYLPVSLSILSGWRSHTVNFKIEFTCSQSKSSAIC